jgi:hypothetical protein
MKGQPPIKQATNKVEDKGEESESSEEEVK